MYSIRIIRNVSPIYYIVCNHDTELDKDHNYEVTTFWNTVKNNNKEKMIYMLLATTLSASGDYVEALDNIDLEMEMDPEVNKCMLREVRNGDLLWQH